MCTKAGCQEITVKTNSLLREEKTSFAYCLTFQRIRCSKVLIMYFSEKGSTCFSFVGTVHCQTLEVCLCQTLQPVGQRFRVENNMCALILYVFGALSFLI